MKKVIILSGIPGSGKSSWAKEHYHEYSGFESYTAHVSADGYFRGVYGEYKFNPQKLNEAHAECLRLYTTDIVYSAPASPSVVLVVDNTNTTALEIAPYAALALAFDFELEIVTFKCPPEVGAARNVHGVPLKTCKDMAERLASRRLPPYWAKFERVIEVTEGP